jgi:S1-C subfamily serine protease
MRRSVLFLAVCLLLASPAAVLAGPEDSVVKVLATLRYPNPLKPWTHGTPVDALGSGTVIDGKRILTNAHLVLYATDVQVQPRRGGSKVEAKVEAIAPDMDLAVLSVKDDTFFRKCPPLRRTTRLPHVQDTVAVYGFPLGGSDLAVTKGVVSRIDFGAYYQEATGLIIQVSAAINPGNSGGPAVVGGRMIGLVFGHFAEGENIGYLIPNEEIDLFLHDVRAGGYRGKLMETAGTEFHRLENKALRSYLKVSDSVHGELVVPPQHRPAGYPFQEFDVLTRIGDYDIDNDGMVQLPGDLRVRFESVVSRAARGGAVPVTVIRKGKRIETSLPVSKEDNRLIRDYPGEKPSYFIHGPLVFSPARASAIGKYAGLRPLIDSVRSPLLCRLTDRVRFPGEELVVVTSPMFSHKIAKGYEDPVGQVVQEVNGVRVRNLKHLVEILRDSRDEYLTFRFAEQGAEVLIFRRAEMEQATEEILDDNGISPVRRGSPDVLRVWQQKQDRGLTAAGGRAAGR